MNYGNLSDRFVHRATAPTAASSSLRQLGHQPNSSRQPPRPSVQVSERERRSTPSARSDGYAPYSQQWNVNLQRELPYNMFVTAAWVGNRVIHLPSQNNKINQMDPKYLTPVWRCHRSVPTNPCWRTPSQRTRPGDGLHAALPELRERLRRIGNGRSGADALSPVLEHLQQLRRVRHHLLPGRADRRSRSASPTVCRSWRATRCRT